MTDLYKEEYQTLRKEVETAMSELNALEYGALAAVSGIFTWLVTHPVDLDDHIIRFSWCIPSILVLLCGLRVFAIAIHLRSLSEYLKFYEMMSIRPRLPGWEHFLSEPKKDLKPRLGFRTKVTGAFWIILFVVTVAGGVAGWCYHPAVHAQEKSPDNSSSKSLFVGEEHFCSTVIRNPCTAAY